MNSYPPGGEQKNAKLNDETAMEVFNSPESHRDVARKYGISEALVRLVRQKKAWKHIHTNGRVKVRTLKEEFEEKYIPVPETGCWLWTAHIDKHGTPIFGSYRYGSSTGPRIAWQLYRGEVPELMVLGHKCGIQSCVNPDHLYLGWYGEWNNKITDDEVRFVRESPQSLVSLSMKLPVEAATLCNIRGRKSRKHVDA